MRSSMTDFTLKKLEYSRLKEYDKEILLSYMENMNAIDEMKPLVGEMNMKDVPCVQYKKAAVWHRDLCALK